MVCRRQDPRRPRARLRPLPGDIRVVPETWKKTWYNWLENIQPWCVSRQLWWGHQIPAWYGPHIDSQGKPAYSLSGDDKPL